MLAADYLFCLVSNFWGVAKSSPVELLHSSNEGEREPKSRWLLAIFGILCLGGGYTIAVTTQNPLDALLLFFIAVILVIIGTLLPLHRRQRRGFKAPAEEEVLLL